jgi:hypothetical protein
MIVVSDTSSLMELNLKQMKSVLEQISEKEQ